MTYMRTRLARDQRVAIGRLDKHPPIGEVVFCGSRKKSRGFDIFALKINVVVCSGMESVLERRKFIGN